MLYAKWQGAVLKALLLLAMVLPVPVQAKKQIPLEHFAMRDVVGDAALSPDGKYLAVMKIPTKDGNPIVEVYETADLGKKPFTFNANPMEIISIPGWVSNRVLVFALRQKVRDIIDDFNQGVYRGKLAYLDMKKKKLGSIEETGLDFEQLLPDKPGKAVVSILESDDGGKSASVPEFYRARSYYEMDFNKGRKKLLVRGSQKRLAIQFDPQGNPVFSRGYNSEDDIWYYRPSGTRDWREIYRKSRESFEDFTIISLDYPREDYALVIAHNGHDKRGLWTFNLKTAKFDELLYRRKDVDVWGVRYHSNGWTHPQQVAAVSYSRDKLRFEYFDGAEGAIYAQLEGLIPAAHYLQIEDRNRDGSSMLIYNEGPEDPGTYYLYRKGKLEVIGSKQPLISSKQLADIRYIKYKARDGRIIPGYLTTPNDDPPFPLIVLPHGGPFVSEVVHYDKWAQMLASRGYMVLQPQYRGSQNYGLEHYLVAFKDGGQGGYTMQDDKDDGALHLIKEGMADPDRIAMFGWSYGGYAALIAASRTPQIYQCVIAGAAVTDTQYQVNHYRYQISGASRTEQLSMWDDSISPINEVSKVNIPILMIHGDVDQRVPLTHAKKYLKELDKHKKPYKYVELKGADHFSNTLFHNHQKTLFTSMIDYLENDCGPGGL